jgi:hypothetical protein
MPKQPNRFIVEVRGGITLFLNRKAEVGDGWWWGSDADPLQHGPFKTSDAALADASRDMRKFKVVRWDMAALTHDDLELRPTGHIVFIDTGGRLVVKNGEPSAAEFQANWQALIDSGEIVPSGEMRPDRSGKLQPVYVLRKFATRH